MVIEQRDAMEIMAAHDASDTLHYADPPYVHSTRSGKVRGTDSRKSYRHEMDDTAHRNFAEFVRGLSGMVIISGYDCPLYSDLFGDWYQVRRKAHADGARDRIEVLWLNKAAADQQLRLIA